MTFEMKKIEKGKYNRAWAFQNELKLLALFLTKAHQVWQFFVKF